MVQGQQKKKKFSRSVQTDESQCKSGTHATEDTQNAGEVLVLHEDRIAEYADGESVVV